MSQIIPGGRPRASSDGDILDEGLCGTLFVNLADHHNEESRKDPRKPAGNVNVNISYNNTNSHLDSSSNDAFDSDSELSSQSQNSFTRSRRRGLFFKSMRKAVSRFVKESKVSDSTLKRSDKTSKNTDPSKVWTPDIRSRVDKFSNKSNGSELSENSTMSTSRPLITDIHVEATIPKWKKTPGTVGIYNHGNSCFMNAVLQCLSNTDSFTEYFVRDFYKNDLKNSTNGKKGVFRSNHGEVTEHLGHLFKCLWSGKYTSEVSKEFKTVVGKFNYQYKGDHQHDSQEFLLWLLDRIHEDVSVFSKKKAKSQKASVLKSDEELASEAALVNGESFVLKLFQALHSSTLTCPTCGERSSTFDPYLCVSLPLPQRCPRGIHVIVISLENHHFHDVKMAFILNHYDTVRELREHVSADTQIPSKQLLLVQVKDDGFGATYSDEQPLSDIPENEVVYAIEAHSDDASIHSSVQEFDSPTSQLLVMHVEVSNGSSHCYRFGSLSMLKVRRDTTWKDLQKEILYKMEDSICDEVLTTQNQKLSNLFMLRLYDGSSRKNYLPCDVDMPLYTQSAERAYTTLDEDFGPPHIKLIAEWDSQTKKIVVLDDEEHLEIHPSVTELQNNPPGQGKVSLDECFRLYTQEEKLIGDDAWLCPHCKQQQQGTIKTLGLWSLPDILVLHLKRFKLTGLRRSKLNTLVDFPVDSLDMSAHLIHRSHSQSLRRDDYFYDLIGVSNHYGNMMGGHYTAYCRSSIDGKWREFNDTKVRILDSPIATREAYLLFYQRRSLSKDVNQRLFTGDHWVFSLPLAPSERVEDNSASGEATLRSVDLSHQSRRSRSRSASPSAHRQANRNGEGLHSHNIPSRPLTPQPFRRPQISYVDDKEQGDESSHTRSPSPEKGNLPRKSRPVQRQSSVPGLEGRREKSAGAPMPAALKDPSRPLYNRRSLEVEQKDSAVDQSKKTLKTELSNGVSTRNHSQTRSKTLERDKPLPQVNVIRHDPLTKGSDLSSNTSKTISHQVLIPNNSLEPDAKYPTSSYDHTRYLDNRKGVPDYESASILQVKFDTSDDYISNRPVKPYHDSSTSMSETETARRKLAQLIKQSSLNKALAERAHVSIDTIEEENFMRAGSRKFDNQKGLDFARLRHLNLDYLGEVDMSQTSTNGHSHRLDIFAPDIRGKDNEFKRDRWHSQSSRFTPRPHGYSPLEEDFPAVGDFGDTTEISVQSELRSKLQDEAHMQGFRKLADKHFGGNERLVDYSRERYKSRFADDMEYQTSDYISSHLNGDLTRLNKFATISRTSDSSQAGRHERDLIPRSSTDHDIHYNNSSLAPPPSPTPPHSLREERAFNHTSISTSLPSTNSDYLSSGRLTSREIASMHSYEFAGQRFSDQDRQLPAGVRTLPGYLQGTRESRYNFRRPRGTWGIKPPQPAPGNIANIPTPCLRESSV